MVTNVALHSPAQLNSLLHVTICHSVATPYPPHLPKMPRFPKLPWQKDQHQILVPQWSIFEPPFNQPNCRSLSYLTTVTHRNPGILHSRVQIDGVDCFRHNNLKESSAPSRYECPHLASSGVIQLWSVVDFVYAMHFLRLGWWVNCGSNQWRDWEMTPMLPRAWVLVLLSLSWS